MYWCLVDIFITHFHLFKENNFNAKSHIGIVVEELDDDVGWMFSEEAWVSVDDDLFKDESLVPRRWERVSDDMCSLTTKQKAHEGERV